MHANVQYPTQETDMKADVIADSNCPCSRDLVAVRREAGLLLHGPELLDQRARRCDECHELLQRLPLVQRAVREGVHADLEKVRAPVVVACGAREQEAGKRWWEGASENGMRLTYVNNTEVRTVLPGSDVPDDGRRRSASHTLGPPSELTRRDGSDVLCYVGLQAQAGHAAGQHRAAAHTGRGNGIGNGNATLAMRGAGMQRQGNKVKLRC